MDKIIKFQASWCEPCKTMSALLQGEDVGVPIEEIDIDENQDLAVEYGIRSVPTLVFVREGMAGDRLIGVKSVAEIREWVKSMM